MFAPLGIFRVHLTPKSDSMLRRRVSNHFYLHVEYSDQKSGVLECLIGTECEINIAMGNISKSNRHNLQTKWSYEWPWNLLPKIINMAQIFFVVV